jgi:hypothetical protein
VRCDLRLYNYLLNYPYINEYSFITTKIALICNLETSSGQLRPFLGSQKNVSEIEVVKYQNTICFGGFILALSCHGIPELLSSGHSVRFADPGMSRCRFLAGCSEGIETFSSSIDCFSSDHKIRFPARIA